MPRNKKVKFTEADKNWLEQNTDYALSKETGKYIIYHCDSEKIVGSYYPKREELIFAGNSEGNPLYDLVKQKPNNTPAKKLSYYEQLIVDATNCPVADVAEIEDYMRHTIFHSTLSWQTKQQLNVAAKQAWKDIQWMRSPEGVAYMNEATAEFYKKEDGGSIDYFKENLEVLKNKGSMGETLYAIRDKNTKDAYVIGGGFYVMRNLRERGFSQKQADDILKSAITDDDFKFPEWMRDGGSVSEKKDYWYAVHGAGMKPWDEHEQHKIENATWAQAVKEVKAIANEKKTEVRMSKSKGYNNQGYYFHFMDRMEKGGSIWLSVDKGEPVTFDEFVEINTAPDVHAPTQDEFENVKFLKVGETATIGNVKIERIAEPDNKEYKTPKYENKLFESGKVIDHASIKFKTAEKIQDIISQNKGGNENSDYENKILENGLVIDHAKVSRETAEQIQELISKTKSVDLFFGHLGNGVSVSDRNREENYDYKKVAHISEEGEIQYYDKNLPEYAIKQIEAAAKPNKMRVDYSHSKPEHINVSAIQKALNGSEFWMNPDSEDAKIIDEAVKWGYVRRPSHTQAYWTDKGSKLFKQGGSVNNTAEILIISSKNPLSSQLSKITGDSWNAINFNTLEKTPNLIKHKNSGAQFVVFTDTYFSSVDKHVINDDLSYLMQYHGITNFTKDDKPYIVNRSWIKKEQGGEIKTTEGGALGEYMGGIMVKGGFRLLGKNGVKTMSDYSKKYPKNIYIVTDDNYSNIGNFYLRNGKFARAETWGNPEYDFANNVVSFRGKDDVIYKFKRINKQDYYKDGGTVELTPNQQMAATILHQLGGQKRLKLFTGAYDIYAIDNGVRFKIKNVDRGAPNYVKIVLTPMDLYDMEIGRIGTKTDMQYGTKEDTYKIVHKYQGVYDDMLMDLFEKGTGMYLHFEKGGEVSDGKIKLVVVDNHTLATLRPNATEVYPIAASVIRGSTRTSPLSSMEPLPIGSNTNIRLASAKDFDDFRVSFDGYNNEDVYEFDKSETFAKGGNIQQKYPDKRWIVSQLRNNLQSRVDYPVLGAFIVGSEAKGTANKNSDLDIAVIIPSSDKISALKRTENYHAKFRSDFDKPKWNGRVVDFQFFYEGDSELAGYSKITLKMEDGGEVFAKGGTTDLTPIQKERVAAYKKSLNTNSKFYEQDVADFIRNVKNETPAKSATMLGNQKWLNSEESERYVNHEVGKLDRAGMFNINRMKPKNALD